MNRPISCYVTLFIKLERDAYCLEKEIINLIEDDNNRCLFCFNNTDKIKKKINEYNLLLDQLIELNNIILRKNLTSENNYIDNCIKISLMKNNILNKCENYITDNQQEEQLCLLNVAQNIR